MDRRRAAKRPPPTSEESQYWSQAAASLVVLNQIQGNSTTADTISKVNKWFSVVPSTEHAAEGIERFQKIRGKLQVGLEDIKASADTEAKAIEDALEHLSVLIALRRAPETQPQEKRTKRHRLASPSSTPGSPHAMPSANPTSLGRSSLGPSPAQNGGGAGSGSGASNAGASQTRSRRTNDNYISAQLPLQPDRKVAFRPPAQKNPAVIDAGGSGDGEGETWILAVVKRCISAERHRYEVQDVDDTEEGEPGQRYNTTLRAIIPLPDPSAPSNSPSHPNAYPYYPAGSIVMGLYPDTSCFYRATVVAGPKDPQPGGRTVLSNKNSPVYRLKFEDDDDQVRAVGVQWVVDWPDGK